MFQISRWYYKGLKVFYYPNLDGAGTTLARPFVKFIKDNLSSQIKLNKIFEWCSGPSFIGFALLAEGICKKLCLADINPFAIQCIKKTVIENNLKDCVSYYVSDNFKSIPKMERFDMVVANPPNYFAINPKHYLWHIFKNDLRPNDSEWRIHRAFYENVSRYLNPKALLFISEVEPFKKEVCIPTSHPIPYDIRKNIPIKDFKTMIQEGKLIYVNTKHYFTFEEGDTKMWMVMSRNK